MTSGKFCEAEMLAKRGHALYSNGVDQSRIAAFNALVEMGSDSECWNWTGGVSKHSGYGIFCWNASSGAAHRFAWLSRYGEIPPDTQIIQTCQNRRCVNPGHLLSRRRPSRWDDWTQDQKAEFFWSFVKKGQADDCWIWQGKISRQTGYGLFRRSCDAHRFAFELRVGELPTEVYVCHDCDNRPCVNLNHLFLGTHGDNMRDMILKNRNVKGESCSWSKMRAAQVLEMRAKFQTGMFSVGQLVEQYPVSQAQVSRILSGTRWASLC